MEIKTLVPNVDADLDALNTGDRVLYPRPYTIVSPAEYLDEDTVVMAVQLEDHSIEELHFPAAEIREPRFTVLRGRRQVES